MNYFCIYLIFVGKNNFINKKANKEMIKKHVKNGEQANVKNSVDKLYKVSKDVLETARKQTKFTKELPLSKKTPMMTNKNAHFLKGKRFENKIASDVSRPDQVSRNEKRIITDYSQDKNKVPIHKVVAYLDDHNYKKINNKVLINGLKKHDEYFRYHEDRLDKIDIQENLISTLNTVKLDDSDEDYDISMLFI